MQTVQKPPPPRKPPRRSDAHKLLSTRGGNALVAIVSALLAAAVLMVFLNQYRDSVSGADDAATVLVAKSLIEKGSAGDVVAEYQLFQTTTVKEADLENGAISDPSSLKGKFAKSDVYPGEQLVASEFEKVPPSVGNRLRGVNRAIGVPVDEAHGLIGNIKAGDHVDVLAGLGLQQAGGENRRATLRYLVRDALVLKAPDKPAGGVAGPNSTKPVVLRVPDLKAAQVALAADIGKVWIVLRAKAGARDSKVPTQDLQSLAAAAAVRVLENADEYLGGEGP
jgi:Flp pilus assembly protein CpaB